MSAIYRKLALLTDEEATKCLNGLVRGLTIEKPEYGRLLDSPKDMEKIINTESGGIQSKKIDAMSPQQQVRAIRVLLTELADHEKFGPQLEAWIDGARDTMLIPLAVPLALAGIIFVLSVDLKIEYKKENGKRTFDFSLKKSPTSEKILEKFFGLFR
jgi:hypothetical protein